MIGASLAAVRHAFSAKSGPPRRDRRVGGLRPGVEPIEARILPTTSPAHVAYQTYITNLVSAMGSPALPDSAVAWWASELDGGQGPLAIDRQILQLPAVQVKLVGQLYEDLLGRAPSWSEALDALGSLGSHGSFRQSILTIVGGDEYFRRSGGTLSGLEAALTRDLSPSASAAAPALANGVAAPSAAARSALARSVMGRADYADPTIADGYRDLTGQVLAPITLARQSATVDARGGLVDLLARVAASPDAGLAGRPATGLAVKRVPGALQVDDPSAVATPYASIAYAATPFQDNRIDGRSIGPGNTDFWTMNLDPSDSVDIQAIDSGTQAVDDGVAIDIWQASTTISDASGVPEAGTTYTLLAQSAGSAYFQAPLAGSLPSRPTTAGLVETPATGGVSILIGFSREADATPDPTTAAAPQPTASGRSALTFDASFRTYPGVQTNTIAMLDDYHDPAYQYASKSGQLDDWPAFTAGQAAAYDALKTAADQGESAGVSAPGAAALGGFTDFREVGDQTDPARLAGYLTAVWDPIQAVIADVATGVTPSVASTLTKQAYGVASVLVDGVYYVYGYTVAEFHADVVAPIEDSGRSGGPSASDFRSVQALIASADAARSALDAFIQSYQNWTSNQLDYLGGVASGVATNLARGIADSSGVVPLMTAPANVLQEASEGLNLVSSALGTVGSAVNVVDPEIKPVLGLLNGITSFAANLTGDFATNPGAQALAAEAAEGEENAFRAINASTVTSEQIEAAGSQLDTDNEDLLLNSSFDLTSILSAMFSNDGLLRAFAGIAFPSPQVGDASTADLGQINRAVDDVRSAVTRSYQLAAYLSLTPEFFQWQNVTDQVKETTLGTDLNNLIPLTASFQTTFGSYSGSSGYDYDQGLWYGLSSPPGSSSPWRLNGSQSDVSAAIRSTIEDFQGGVPLLSLGAGSPNYAEEVGSLAGAGLSGSKYIIPYPFAGSIDEIRPDTYDSGPLGRFYAAVPVAYTASATLTTKGSASADGAAEVSGVGYDVMEWGLFNPATGQAMSTAAARELFGTPDLSGSTLEDPEGQAYLSYDTPADALANVADVFFSRDGWSVGGGGDASAGYGGQVVGDASALDVAPGSAEPSQYRYDVTPLPSSAAFPPPDQPPPASGSLGSSIVAPATGSITIAPGTYLASPSGRYFLIFQSDGNLVLYDSRAADEVLWASNTAGHPGAQLRFSLAAGLVITDGGTGLWASTSLDSKPISLADPGVALGVSDDGAAALTVSGAGGTYPMIAWTTQPLSQGLDGGDDPEPNWIGLDASDSMGSILRPGQSLTLGKYLLSPSGQYALVMQSNAQLVLYDLWSRDIAPLWRPQPGSIANEDPPAEATMLPDGTFVLGEGTAIAFDVPGATYNKPAQPGSYLRLQDDGNLVVYTPGGQAAWASNTVQS